MNRVLAGAGVVMFLGCSPAPKNYPCRIQKASSGEVFTVAELDYPLETCIRIVEKWNRDPYLTGDTPKFTCACTGATRY